MMPLHPRPGSRRAQAALGCRTPDLIVLDVRLPDTNGWMFLERSQQRPSPHAPVTVLTAAVLSLGLGAPTGRQGGVAVLLKPFDSDASLRRVATHIAGPHSRV